MFACTLFREANETVELKGVNTDTIPTLISIVCCAGIEWFEFAKIKATKIILHMMSPILGQPN